MSTAIHVDEQAQQPEVRTESAPSPSRRIECATQPEHYRHWTLSIDGRVATLAMDVREDAPPGSGL